MKKIVYMCLAVCLAMQTSCYKDEPDQTDFTVTPDNLVVRVDDSIRFNFEGYADLITFYSGETGQEYIHRDRTEAEGLGLQLSIASQVLWGAQQNNVRLLLSTAFSGIYSPDDIVESEWTDITDKFTLSASPAGTPGTVTNSGPVDLSSYIVAGRPMYFAYRYESQAAPSAAQAGRGWRFPVFKLETVTAEGTSTELTNVTSAGWREVRLKSAVERPENTSTWVIQAGSPFLFFDPKSSTEPHLHWMITAPLSPTAMRPDKPLTIKGFIDKMETTFAHRFSSTGRYKVTFVAANVNSHGRNEIVKEFEIEVVE